MALLWSDRGDQQARSSLRQALSGLRKDLGEQGLSALRVTDETLTLDPERVIVEPASPGDVLLDGLHVADPAFEEWLRDERLRLEDVSNTEPQPPALSLPDKPSIAVLPFRNMSGDAEQDYFTDGITEDIITNLSRFRDLFVIASHSSFAYKGEAVKIPDVSWELGVRYVLEGSVQKSGDQVRINAQLVDGPTGRHLWAERYQRQIEDIFALQDEVTELIVGTLASAYGGRLRKAWQAHSERRSPGDYQAYDCFMRAMDAFDLTQEGARRGRELFHEAIRLDPHYAKAHAKLAWTHLADAFHGWGQDYEASMAKGLEVASESIARDDSESWGHWALAGYHLYSGHHDLALNAMERAVEINPNDADVLTDVGLFLTYAGRPEEALEMAQKAMRLNPHYPEWYLAQLVQIYHDARQYEAGLNVNAQVREMETTVLRLYQAACAAGMRRDREAKAAITRVLELDPQASLRKWTDRKMAPY